ncbi:MAG: hypothetical protein ACLR8R_10255 [Oscillospiraceae bacterium]
MTATMEYDATSAPEDNVSSTRTIVPGDRLVMVAKSTSGNGLAGIMTATITAEKASSVIYSYLLTSIADQNEENIIVFLWHGSYGLTCVPSGTALAASNAISFNTANLSINGKELSIKGCVRIICRSFELPSIIRYTDSNGSATHYVSVRFRGRSTWYGRILERKQ